MIDAVSMTRKVSSVVKRKMVGAVEYEEIHAWSAYYVMIAISTCPPNHPKPEGYVWKSAYRNTIRELYTNRIVHLPKDYETNAKLSKEELTYHFACIPFDVQDCAYGADGVEKDVSLGDKHKETWTLPTEIERSEDVLVDKILSAHFLSQTQKKMILFRYKGMSPDDIAIALGFSRRTYTNYLNGIHAICACWKSYFLT